MTRTSRALAPDCAIRGDAGFHDAPLITSELASVGEFRCPASYPSFRDTGPTERCLVVFPRTSVWIQHEGSHRFLADPTVITIYNREQRYERFAASALGDRCDWFAVDERIAREIVSTFDPATADSPRPYRFEWAPSDASLYLRQRALVHRARRMELEIAECEEEVIGVVADAIRGAYAGRVRPSARRSAGHNRLREIVDGARMFLLETVCENKSVHEIASGLGTSPYHLCRLFRAHTGTTMHAYRTQLRVRLALELLEEARGGVSTLSAIAHELGFSSHSHFVRAMRRHVEVTPSAARRMVAGAVRRNHSFH